MTKSASAARKILEHSAHYDYLINSTLNEQKCQVYHSPAVEPESIKDILLGAARTRRPWSLGFALPASGPAVDKSEEAGEKLNDRYLKARATAERASVLPHDTQCVVLEACFPSQFSYGTEYEAPDGEQLAELSAPIIKSLWGTGRRSRSAAILWTVLYKGHRLLPEVVIAINAARFLYVVATRCDEGTRETLVDIRGEAKHAEHSNPVRAMQKACDQQGWQWLAPFRVRVLQCSGEVDIDFKGMDWAFIAHELREAARWRLVRQRKLHARWDMRGFGEGIDYSKTGKLLDARELGFFQKGLLRTILAG